MGRGSKYQINLNQIIMHDEPIKNKVIMAIRDLKSNSGKLLWPRNRQPTQSDEDENRL
jgi:hypothetical protein